MSFDLHTVKHAPRTLTVCSSSRSLPRIVLCGEWVRQWGFEIGDRFLAHYAGVGALLLKIRTDEEGGNFPASSLPGTLQPVSPSDAIKYRLHPTQVRTPDGRLPKITIVGNWLHQWNIRIGDKVSVARSENGDILIHVTPPVPYLHEIKAKKRLEQEAAYAVAALEAHKARYPHLYEESAQSPNIHIEPIKYTKRARPSKIIPEYSVTVIGPGTPLPASA